MVNQNGCQGELFARREVIKCGNEDGVPGSRSRVAKVEWMQEDGNWTRFLERGFFPEARKYKFRSCDLGTSLRSARLDRF